MAAARTTSPLISGMDKTETAGRTQSAAMTEEGQRIHIPGEHHHETVVCGSHRYFTQNRAFLGEMLTSRSITKLTYDS